MDNITLKACPFCGCTAQFRTVFNENKNVYFTSVRCSFCFAQTRAVRTEDDPRLDESGRANNLAAESWNLRA